jgi:hypothetical protein
MTELSISQAARAAGKTRATLYKYIKSGSLSVRTSPAGKKVIDSSELIRVFGELKTDGNKRIAVDNIIQEYTPKKEPENNNQNIHIMNENEHLKKLLQQSQEREARLIALLENQTRLLLPAPGTKKPKKNKENEVDRTSTNEGSTTQKDKKRSKKSKKKGKKKKK